MQYANPYCELLYGRRPATMIGQESTSFSAEPISRELRGEIGRAPRDGRSWEGDFTVVRRDGTTVDVHAIDSPVFDEDGEVTGVITLAFYATEQRRAQHHLRRMFAIVQILRDVGETA